MSSAGWRLEMRYAALPSPLFSTPPLHPVAAPKLLVLNGPLAQALGLDAAALRTPDGVALLAGNALPPGVTPIAQAYAGHQFGHFTILGDGRQMLLGEQIAPDGARFDVALKGSGRTAYSRSGDGRAALGPMLREYILSQAFVALGIPTTRSLAVVATGETVIRDRLLQGAVLTRVAASHIRVGTAQYAAASPEGGLIAPLMEHVRWRHYPDIAVGDWAGLFGAIMARQARLVAQWMAVGFIHGVMNSDNMALSGETIDYGPCAFMDAYDPETVFSSIDRHGRYAWGEQPRIAQWNLARLAEAMLPLFDAVPEAALARANDVLTQFPALFEAAWLGLMRAKLGLGGASADDAALVQGLQAAMLRAGADWTLTFRALATDSAVEPALAADTAFADWRAALALRQSAAGRAGMRAASPAIVPRNHQVEAALAAAERGDLLVMERLLAALSRAFEDDDRDADYRGPGGVSGYQTFCGT